MKRLAFWTHWESRKHAYGALAILDSAGGRGYCSL